MTTAVCQRWAILWIRSLLREKRARVPARAPIPNPRMGILFRYDPFSAVNHGHAPRNILQLWSLSSALWGICGFRGGLEYDNWDCGKSRTLQKTIQIFRTSRSREFLTMRKERLHRASMARMLASPLAVAHHLSPVSLPKFFLNSYG